MLETIALQPFSTVVYRFSNTGSLVEMATRMSIDAEGIDELIELMRSSNVPVDDPEEVLDGPFTPKPFFPYRSRFSDGTIKIYYGSVEPETATAEAEHFVGKRILDGVSTSTQVFLRLTKCNFSGPIKDLRTKTVDWPFLISDDWSNESIEIGAEAESGGAHGLLTVSARRLTGTNLPVFRRESLSNGLDIGHWVFTFDAARALVSGHQV